MPYLAWWMGSCRNGKLKFYKIGGKEEILDYALIQPYSGHESRISLEIYYCSIQSFHFYLIPHRISSIYLFLKAHFVF
jgi:hypothetical protein